MERGLIYISEFFPWFGVVRSKNVAGRLNNWLHGTVLKQNKKTFRSICPYLHVHVCYMYVNSVCIVYTCIYTCVYVCVCMRVFMYVCMCFGAGDPCRRYPGRASLRSVGRQELDVPRTRLVSSERAFEVAAPKAWNKLPVDIKSTRDTGLFKKQLKTFLFRAAYPVSC